jgi:hypothetical protein
MTAQELIELAIEIRKAPDEFEGAKLLNHFEGAAKKEGVEDLAAALREEEVL